ncbi:hypothetical protein HA466_0077190 [Hirschfeldia incana]|nr:hypothetical protein HA466_0077190 [Hirschfeldia incana]
MDLLIGVSAPNPPGPPDASETLVALDPSSFPCHCFTLAAARSLLHSTTRSDSVCLLIVSRGVNLVKPLLFPTDGCRFGFLVLCIRNRSRPLPQYEDLMLLYEVLLPQYEVHLPQYEISFQGSSRWCLMTSVAKFLAALCAVVSAACSGSSLLSVISNSRGFISLGTHGVSLLSCLCVMFAFTYLCAIRFAFDAAVSLANVVVLLFMLNNSSFDGV